LFCVTLLTPFPFFGQDFSINGRVLARYRGDADHVTIPEGITTIGNQAFFLCVLTSVTIPPSVTSIGENAFIGCSSLISVNIPAGVTSIGYGAFLNCSSLSSITVDSRNRAYSSEDGVLFNKNKTVLIQYPADKPESTYTVPASVISISEYAFSDSNHLISVSIPAGVTFIGKSALGCLNLRSVQVDSQNMSFSSEGGVLFNKNKTVLIQYPGNRSAESYTVPVSVASIEDYAFADCNNLRTVVVSRRIKIGKDVFPEGIEIVYSD